MYRYGWNAVSQHKVSRAAGEDVLPGQTHGETNYRMVHMGTYGTNLPFLTLSHLFQPHIGGKSPGKALIENLCMKAVNQSIGRWSLYFCNSVLCLTDADCLILE